MSLQEIKSLIEDQGAAWVRWKEKNEAKYDELYKEVEQLAIKANRPGFAAGSSGGFGNEVKYLQTAGGHKLPLIGANQKCADFFKSSGDEEFSIGQFAKDAICGSTKASSSAALVPTGLSSRLIDMVRARTVVREAGAGTIILDGPTNIAKLTGDPTVYQHTEGATDISESDVTVAAIAANPKLLAVLIPLTVELVSDSPNLDNVLNTALSAAFAQKLDALCISTLLADTAIPKSAVTHDPADWAKVIAAVGAALALNQRLPGVHISAPADFIARASQMINTNNGWLGRPPALAGMTELQTTGLTAGTALMGDFAAGFAIGMRSDLRVEIVRHQKPTSASHLLVAHMRADGFVLQAAQLFKQLKTVA